MCKATQLLAAMDSMISTAVAIIERFQAWTTRLLTYGDEAVWQLDAPVWQLDAPLLVSDQWTIRERQTMRLGPGECFAM